MRLIIFYTFLWPYLADKVWDPQSPVNLLESYTICVVQQRVQLIQECPLIALTLARGRGHQKIIQGVSKLSSATHKGAHYEFRDKLYSKLISANEKPTQTIMDVAFTWYPPCPS